MIRYPMKISLPISFLLLLDLYFAFRCSYADPRYIRFYFNGTNSNTLVHWFSFLAMEGYSPPPHIVIHELKSNVRYPFLVLQNYRMIIPAHESYT